MLVRERLHALDAVRAFALLSGILLHAAMSFMPGLAAIGFPADNSQSSTLQVMFYVIHVFRMSLFFFIAGYFAHLAFHRKGASGFVRDRTRRILLPLLAGWLVFGPIAMALVFVAFGPDAAQTRPAPTLTAVPLSHLWFLYYLLLIYAAVLSVRHYFVKLDADGALRRHIDRGVRSLVQGRFAPMLFALPLAACLYFTPNWIMWIGIPTPDMGLTPRAPALVGYGTAFALGWLIQRQTGLLEVWKQRWAKHMLFAVVLTAASWWTAEHPAPADMPTALVKLIYAGADTAAIWHWVFGLTGAALRFCCTENRAVRYLADASYWMYLAHLPVVFALQLIVRNWPLHWSIKFPLIVAAATTLLLLSYRYLVRGTFIGSLLNGRKTGPDQGSDAVPAVRV